MTDSPTTHTVLVVIPTYNERENITSIISRTLNAVPYANILVVDDGSPDGTGTLVEEIGAADQRVRVMHRTEKNGLGAAYLAGFAEGFTKDYDLLVELDADGSHPPERLPALIDAVTTGGEHVGGAIGSRWVPGGSVVNWPWYRQVISRCGSWYARTMLGLRTRDITAGFRVYRADVLRKVVDSGVESHGYCFQIDLTRRAVALGYNLVEVPIEFREREAGVSKMSTGIVVEAMGRVTVWGFQRVFSRR